MPVSFLSIYSHHDHDGFTGTFYSGLRDIIASLPGTRVSYQSFTAFSVITPTRTKFAQSKIVWPISTHLIKRENKYEVDFPSKYRDTMAPLLDSTQMDDSCDDIFSLWPMKLELNATLCEPLTLDSPKTSFVRFEDEIGIINPLCEYYTEEDLETKWLGPGELHQVKQQAKEDSSNLRKETKGQHTSLCLAHRKTSLMLKSDFKSLVKLSPTTPDQDLTEWSSSDDGRRGLERFASRDYAALRRKDICDTRTAVIEEYSRQQTFHVKDDEAIADMARDSSRRARTFARFFAAADAIAARSPVEPIRRLPARCHSDIRTLVRRTPPRKRSKQYHREEFFPVSTC